MSRYNKQIPIKNHFHVINVCKIINAVNINIIEWIMTDKSIDWKLCSPSHSPLVSHRVSLFLDVANSNDICNLIYSNGKMVSCFISLVFFFIIFKWANCVFNYEINFTECIQLSRIYEVVVFIVVVNLTIFVQK